MTPIAWTAVLSFAVLAVYLYCHGVRVSPDGRKYFRLAQGEPQPIPFNLRWLLPFVLRENVIAWQVVTMASLLGTSVTIAAIALRCGASDGQSIAAGLIFAGLPIVRTCIHLPILVDAPALLCVALAVLADDMGLTIAVIVCALVGGAIKETVPVFIAAATLNPLPLVGLVVPAVAYFAVPRAPATEPCTATPFKYAREKQSGRLLDARLSLLPWGACAVVLFGMTGPVAASLALGYALLLVASDSARVFQFGAVPVCVLAAMLIPVEWVVPALALHLLNPWQGEL